jgi:NADH-quinone oxidoreductase subunit M
MIRPDNVLVWATFFPLIGAGIILVLVSLRYAFGLTKRFVDNASRFVALSSAG